MSKDVTGLLVVNLGTPNSPSPFSVGKYLREFLMDPLVIDIPYIFRWLLVNLIIVPFRSFRSAKAYKSIWTSQGSPLMIHTESFAQRLGKELGDNWSVKIGMRYGRPSLKKALKEFEKEGITTVKVFSLYPQYADSTIGTVNLKLRRIVDSMGSPFEVEIVPPFYGQEYFINPYLNLIRKKWNPDFSLVFSFHGLPERHLQKQSSQCLTKDCCKGFMKHNPKCYRAQCFESAGLLARGLGLDSRQYIVSFQSRLGRDPWLKPYTVDTLKTLGEEGKSVIVVTPSFVSDCLETLEEIDGENRDVFEGSGGKAFDRVACLNGEVDWVESVAQYLKSEDLSLMSLADSAKI